MKSSLSDLEGLANKLLNKKFSTEEIKKRLREELLIFKDLRKDMAEKIADAVLKEVTKSRASKSKFMRRLIGYPEAHVSMGEMGVGSRGEGDLFVHKLIAKIASAKTPPPILGPLSLDDAGVVSYKNMLVSVAVDGTHSRLSNYPFLAGFHVTRACLRDVYVKGAKPLALFDDIHLADDGDVGKLFDFVAGINTVASLMKVPLISGSTLRIGGDMVIGDRMVSCVGAVGVLTSKRNLTARRNIKAGDAILMTHGAGGGTIVTTAIYSGNFDAIIETLNINFLKVCENIINSSLVTRIHAMTDVTNGGIRGDANTICKEANVGLVINGNMIENLVNSRILKMLKENSIDPLGISLDSLLIFTSQEESNRIINSVRRLGVKIDKIGFTTEKPVKAQIQYDGKRFNLQPKFRESAYTKIKKVIGEESPKNKRKIEGAAEKAFKEAMKKRNYFFNLVKSRK